MPLTGKAVLPADFLKSTGSESWQRQPQAEGERSAGRREAEACTTQRHGREERALAGAHRRGRNSDHDNLAGAAGAADVPFATSRLDQFPDLLPVAAACIR